MWSGSFCPALAKAAKTMKKAEEVLLSVKPQYGSGEKGRPSSCDEGAVPPNATLFVKLELVSWKSVIEIGDDKKIIKNILNEGEEQVIEGLDRAVTTTKKGDIALVGIRSHISGCYILVMEQLNLTYQINLREKESWDMNNEEKIAAKKKEEGNAFFKLGKFGNWFWFRLTAKNTINRIVVIPSHNKKSSSKKRDKSSVRTSLEQEKQKMYQLMSQLITARLVRSESTSVCTTSPPIANPYSLVNCVERINNLHFHV
ncbi:70 kDa peptidyl-prolyl isomerase-like [Canna indica]|uniref:peptidylprolyl isomerase n=1 Tax=Canna indica TaxID=4628 RepID=A0AAQ3QDF6_9LILI|nr:70 kDa peptidyl-prolyl isomerase-like [Canna indica]